FAHGDIYMVGAYVCFALTTFFNIGFLPALLISMAATSLLGIIVEKIAYKHLSKSPRITALITAISITLLLQYTVMYFVGPQTRTFHEVLESKSLKFLNGNVILDVKNIYIIAITLILMIALQFIVR